MFERPARTDFIYFKVLNPHPYKTRCHWHTQVYKPTIKFNLNVSFLFAAFAWEWSTGTSAVTDSSSCSSRIKRFLFSFQPHY